VDVEASGLYKVALIAVTAITLASFIIYMVAGWQIAKPTKSQAQMLETASSFAKGGFGMFLGLLVGKH
jgi:hypothetical protein